MPGEASHRTQEPDAGARTAPPPPLDRRAQFWALQVGGWGLFWAGMVLAGLTHWSLGFTLVFKTLLAVGGLLVTSLLRLAYRGLSRTGLPYGGVVASTLPLSWLTAGAWMAANNELTARLLTPSFGGSGLTPGPFPDFGNTVYYTFLLLAWSALYFGIQAYLDLLAGRRRLHRAEELARQARLEALRLQLQPHFLFNTLNSISTLIAEGRGADANRMLSRLADFLRLTLEAPSAPEASLGAEIELARRYVEIEEVRFGERLRLDLEVEPECQEARVPAMLLQPLVENAVRHAVALRSEGGRIVLGARRRAGALEIDVEDDGPGFPAAVEPGAGVGLANCRHRLAQLYGGAARLELGSGRLGGARVRIRLPLAGALPAEAPR
jgi:two-component system, LytTR family, sensor kinase